MSWASTSDLRALVHTEQSDDEVSSILTQAQDEITAAVSDTSNSYIKTAHLYKSALLCLIRMQTNGELAYLNKVGSIQRYNDIEKTIQLYEREYAKAIRRVMLSSTTDATYTISKKFTCYEVSR